MKIDGAVSSAANTENQVRRGRRFSGMSYSRVAAGNSAWAVSGSRLQQLQTLQQLQSPETKENEKDAEETTSQNRSEAEKIYQAAIAGKGNPLENLREAPKVPYGNLAKDGVIIYNGVCFVCDEKTNSICLGDMTDTENVLNIPLSGGGQLKVNRANLGQLSKAAGMFSPEDLKRIMEAIHLDTKIQATEKEIDDMEASVGNGGKTAETDENLRES